VIVAIDGPAGAGKSTVARALAERLGIGYLNTGSMYRALTLLAIRAGVDQDDPDGLAGLARGHEIALRRDVDGRERVLLDGEDVTEACRRREVTDAVSLVAAHGPVRAAIVELQRAVLADGDWVADGRDIGSVVCPDAEVKVYLTAVPEERARRRHAELAEAGEDVQPGDVLQDIVRRDALDSTRAESPLVVAADATVVDTTGLDVPQVVDVLAALARERVS
jgi:cytidylate kinase